MTTLNPEAMRAAAEALIASGHIATDDCECTDENEVHFHFHGNKAAFDSLCREAIIAYIAALSALKQMVGEVLKLDMKLVPVYDSIKCEGRWPGTTEMVDAGMRAFEESYGPHGMRETLMAVYNAMVTAAP